jgi:hypothetical protein
MYLIFIRPLLECAGEVWDHKTILAPPLFIEVRVPSRESERSCIRVLVVLLLSAMIFVFISSTF